MKKSILKYIPLLVIALMIGSCSQDDATSPASSESTINGGGSTGQGGSMARFTIAKNHLFIVTEEGLSSYSLADPSQPEFLTKVLQRFTVETIFGLGDHLFLGTPNGVAIFSIENPASPTEVSFYRHVTSCDPVVADQSYAYSTLRTDSRCNRGVNRLDIIDINDIENPFQISSLDMENPKGLGKTGDYLYVCDNDVLKCLDVSNPAQPVQLHSIPFANGYDVIVRGDILMAVSSDKVTQFTIKDNGALSQLSTIYED